MVKGLQVGIAMVLGILLGMTGISAQAIPVTHQRSTALSVGRLRSINDRAVHYVGVPRKYQHARRPHGVNRVTSSHGRRVTFATKYLLPYPGYHHQAWGNPQSMTTDNRYLYVIYCPTAWKNRGRLVRYDLRKLAANHVTPRDLQRVYVTKAKKARAIKRAIKIGPAFVTGHGQSLAYNWKEHHLYMWCDRESAPRVPTSQYGYMTQISGRRLKPTRQVRCRLKQGKFAVPGGHVLTFDHSGHAYFWSRPTAHRVYLYRGTVRAHHVKFRLTHQVLRRGPGTRVQSIAYNSRTKRLYLVADDSIANLPVRKLAGRGHLTSRDIRWNRFSSRREFEGLTFARNGRAYLLSNHNPEVMISNRQNW
ncbi:hypothetical protein HEQ45_09530 [Lactobacillus sp. ZJLC29-4]|uniref:Extracellular protein n=1 Tax=Levilactobacillus tujiorum TaxID=2912243 RepID=A0ABX1L632_9LACO|nr:hypothetical protein [Lactobacillus sp. HBUAS51387]NLR30525.1 hypothetical protein [Levilactobacillus tujiorum]